MNARQRLGLFFTIIFTGAMATNSVLYTLTNNHQYAWITIFCIFISFIGGIMFIIGEK